ncbi:MAG: two-component sensor histidine kinase [Eggerthellaceae bacterium]|nr:two-component sensor histidine kinase [Eggerthellaceae bacterium]
MENFLIHNRDMKPRDWAFDVALAVMAFAFGCVQMVLTTSNVFMPNPELREILGIEAIVPDAPAFVALALTTLPLVLRRRFPWPVFLFVFVVFLGLQAAFNGTSLSIGGPMVAVFTVAAERTRVEMVVAAVLAASGVLLASASTAAQTASLLALTWLQNIALLEASVFAGYSARTHRNFLEASEQRAQAAELAREEAERAREEEAARRVEAERVRIAREVHDITAHSLSAVSIQAAAAERLLDRNPQAAKEAIVTARQTAKDALEEIRSMIGVLRQGEAAETEPTVGTERLGDLVSYLENAGVRVTLDAHRYDASQVPAFVDVATYSIAREAVTNIVRHAQASHARITLSLENDSWLSLDASFGLGDNATSHAVDGFDGALSAPSPAAAEHSAIMPAAAGLPSTSAPSPVAAVRSAITHAAAGLPSVSSGGSRASGGRSSGSAASGSPSAGGKRFVRLRVEDDGCGMASSVTDGHGIKGMTERAKLLGGTLTAENGPNGGFCLTIVIPLALPAGD